MSEQLQKEYITDYGWMDDGACANITSEERDEKFFAINGKGIEEAKEMCSTCEVQPECLEYALDNRIDHGVWGGESARGRKRIRRARRLASES